MKPAAFRYVKAASVEEAIETLKVHPNAKVLAGGQSLVPLMNFRLNRPDVVVDINGIGELDQVMTGNGELRLGALVRHQRLVDEAVVAQTIPVMAQAARHIGHWGIRNRGTVGGSVAHADPAAELPALMTALNATIVAESPTGEQRYRAADFFLGYYTTALTADQLIVRFHIPVPSGSMGFAEVVRRPGDFALAGAIAHITVTHGAITWFGLGGRPERYAVEEWPSDEDGRRALLRDLVERIDLSGEEEYKRDIAINAALRALRQAEEA